MLCSSNFAQYLCIPPAGGPTFCLADRVKIAPLQGSLAASVFPFLLSATGNAQRQADCWSWRIRETALWSEQGELWDLFHSLSLSPIFLPVSPVLLSLPLFTSLPLFFYQSQSSLFHFFPPMFLVSYSHFGHACWHPRAPKQKVAVLHSWDKWVHWEWHRRRVSTGERGAEDKDSTWTTRFCKDDMGNK